MYGLNSEIAWSYDIIGKYEEALYLETTEKLSEMIYS